MGGGGAKRVILWIQFACGYNLRKLLAVFFLLEKIWQFLRAFGAYFLNSFVNLNSICFFLITKSFFSTD